MTLAPFGALAEQAVRQSVESSARDRFQWLTLDLPTGFESDQALVPEWREAYRRLWGDAFFKAEFAVLRETHERPASVDFNLLRGELQGGVRLGGLYWLAEWRGRYAARDGWDDTLSRQQQWGLRAKSNVLPEPPEGVDLDIQPNLYFGYVEAWPDALDRFNAEAEFEFVTRINHWINVIAAPKLEWLYYLNFAGGEREDLIESLRVSTRLRLGQGWSLTLETQIARTESTHMTGDSFGVSVTPIVRNVIKF